MIMSGFSKVKMSGLMLKMIRFSFKEENLDERGHFKDESEGTG